MCLSGYPLHGCFCEYYSNISESLYFDIYTETKEKQIFPMKMVRIKYIKMERKKEGNRIMIPQWMYSKVLLQLEWTNVLWWWHTFWHYFSLFYSGFTLLNFFLSQLKQMLNDLPLMIASICTLVSQSQQTSTRTTERYSGD